LNIAQAEAEAAAVKAGVELENLDVQFEGFEEDGEDIDELAQEKPRAKERTKVMEKREEVAKRKTKVGGRARRRKSTLTPEELEKLMMFD
jgi:hypothetical protein